MTLDPTRRDVLNRAATLGLGAMASALLQPALLAADALPGPGPAEPRPQSARDFFPGFRKGTYKTSAGVTINYVAGGSGPGLLLLHGYPETHIMWRKVAPELSQKFTVVAPDMRGYGDSSKPPGGDDHFAYSKRAMAQDAVELMASLGFQKFALMGHDRGARVSHRLAIDHRDSVDKLVVLDIVPTYKVFASVNQKIATSSFHWFFLIQPAPIPETMLANNVELWLKAVWFKGLLPDAIDPQAYAEYLRCFSDPGMIHATCEDYRAGASIDLEHDKSDIDHKIACPVLAVWGSRGRLVQLYDVVEAWKERALDVRGGTVSSGHFIAEENPQALLAAVKPFLG